MLDTDRLPSNERLPSYHQWLPEALMIQNLIDLGTDGPKLNISFPRHNSYDFHEDGVLTPDELYLIPASPGNDELRGVLE